MNARPRPKTQAQARWLCVAPWLLLWSVLSGCQSTPENPEQAIRAATPQDSSALHIDLIRQLMQKDQYFAAMAHIDAAQTRRPSRAQTDQLGLLRAECLRKTQQLSIAETAYRALLRSSVGARAAHGLGLTLASRDPIESLRYLELAVEKQPTAPDIRNDLGYALMLNGQFAAAHRALSTAHQLAPDDAKPRNNLIVLLLATGRTGEAGQLEAEAGLDAQTRRGLRQQAARITETNAARLSNGSGV